MKEDAYAASGILGKLLCGLSLHKYCNHPEIRSDVKTLRLAGVYGDHSASKLYYFCPKCEQEFDFNGEKFVPLSETKYCLRCGHIRVDRKRERK